MTKRAYLYEETTKKYNGFWDCQESPLEPGVFIQPTHSTDVEPPTFDGNTHDCVWSESEWKLTKIE